MEDLAEQEHGGTLLDAVLRTSEQPEKVRTMAGDHEEGSQQAE